MTQPVLRTQQLSVSYGGVRALNDMTLEVRPGQLVGLIGPNGAGKSTFVDALSGFTECEGDVWLDDDLMTGLSPSDRARAGLARTWQSIEVFEDLTVRENLVVAAHHPSPWESIGEVLRGRYRSHEAVEDTLSLLGLSSIADAPSDSLSQGEKKLVGVARALVSEPRIVCLDEPAAGLDRSESVLLGERLRSVVHSGIPILLIDHDMSLVLSVSDYVYVLDFGRTIAHGHPQQVRQQPEVVKAYLGKDAEGVDAPSQDRRMVTGG